MGGIDDIVAERATHDGRGWTAEHDEELGYGHLILLAQDRARAAYSLGNEGNDAEARRQMVKAASLLLAGIELVDRVGNVT